MDPPAKVEARDSSKTRDDDHGTVNFESLPKKYFFELKSRAKKK